EVVSSELEQVEGGQGGGQRFATNLVRLLGLHGVTATFVGQQLGISTATLSAWAHGKSSPSLANAILFAEFFEVPTDRLMSAEFADLLANELADPGRFERFEERIRRARTPLQPVEGRQAQP